MNGFDLIFYAIFAAFMVYRLFSALGKDDYEPDEEKQKRLIEKKKALEEESRIVEASFEIVKEDIPTKLQPGVKALQKHDPAFRLSEFKKGAESAFDIIIQAFCEGDKETLKYLLDTPLYTTFGKEIDRRKKAGEIHSCTIIAIDDVKIPSINIKENEAWITVEFDSQQVEVVKNKAGKVIEGDPSNPEKRTDIWVFKRPLTSNDPNWLLVETHG